MPHFGNALFQWNDHNLLAYSEDVGQWDTAGAPTLSSGQNDPLGGTNAWLLEDDNAAGLEYVQWDLDANVFTTSSQKALMMWIKDGTSGSTNGQLINFTDLAGSTLRVSVQVQWASSGPTFTFATGSLLWHRPFPGSWWQVAFLSSPVTVASSHRLEFRPAHSSTSVGDAYMFGGHVCDVNTAGSYVATNGTAIPYSTTAPAQSHSLQAPLRVLRPAVRTQSFVRESLDLAHRQVTTVADPRHETLGTIRYESDQDSFHAFLSAAARFPVSYIPSSCDLNDAHECWAIVQDPLDSAMDADRGFPGFEDVSLEIRLRRLDGQASTGIYG